MLALYLRWWHRVAALCAVWCLLAPPAAANIGLPMLAVVWPVSWVLFVPIVLVEALVGTRVLSLSYWKTLWRVSLANTISTLVGIPLTWFVLVLLSRLPGSSHVVGSDANLDNLLAVAISAPWLKPTEPEWIVPTAALMLCVPFFLISVWIEGLVVRRFTPEPVSGRAFRWSWRANLATYVPICAALLAVALNAARRS